MFVCTQESQKRTWDILELELQSVVSHWCGCWELNSDPLYNDHFSSPVCMGVLPVCVSLHHMYAVACRSQKRAGPPGTGLTDCCELPCGNHTPALWKNSRRSQPPSSAVWCFRGSTGQGQQQNCVPAIKKKYLFKMWTSVKFWGWFCSSVGRVSA